jgi:intracellular sulfur oxidation DsrE/DsrF family protein
MMPPEGSYNLDPATHYKVSIDIGDTAEFPGDLNRKLVSSARFLNMHAQTGIPEDNIDFAIIVHGKAAQDLLKNDAYEKRFNTANPNTALLEQLHDAGAKIYVCSQTALFRGMDPEEFHPAVTMAMSAMTSHVRLQQEGYTLIPF